MAGDTHQQTCTKSGNIGACAAAMSFWGFCIYIFLVLWSQMCRLVPKIPKQGPFRHFQLLYDFAAEGSRGGAPLWQGWLEVSLNY